MKRLSCHSFVITVLATAAVAIALQAAASHAEPVVIFKTDRESALYQCGEPATFILEVTNDGVPARSGIAQVQVGVAGGRDLLNRSVDLAKENPVRFTETLDEPGFLLAKVTGIPGTGKVLAGAGFDPKMIVPGNDLPEDFSEFWEAGRTALAGKPVHLEKLDAYSTTQYTSYAVTVEVLHGEHLYGFLTVPNQPGKFPIVVAIPGAGPGWTKPPVDWVKRGVISLVMNVHKVPVITGNDKANKAQFEARQAKGKYSLDHAGDRDHYHFRNVILGIDRMINELAGRPDWNGQHLVLDGSSQGGGLSLILAGFNSHVTAVAANVPALGDHGAGKFHRQPGWPNLVSAGAEALAISPYYDSANFARNIHCPTLVSAGFIDTTCAPSSVYAVWNRIPSSHKTILNMPGQGHGMSDEYKAVKVPWLENQLGLDPPSGHS